MLVASLLDVVGDQQHVEATSPRRLRHEPQSTPLKFEEPHNLRRLSPVLGSRGVLRRSLRLTVAQRRSPSSCRTMIMERTNNQIKPTVSSTIRVTPAARGSEPTSGDTAGNTTQLRIPIGMAANAALRAATRIGRADRPRT